MNDKPIEMVTLESHPLRQALARFSAFIGYFNLQPTNQPTAICRIWVDTLRHMRLPGKQVMISAINAPSPSAWESRCHFAKVNALNGNSVRL
jgi:hypothetical protein